MNCKSSSFRLIIVSLIIFAQLFSANKCNAQNHDTASVYIYNLANAINVLKDDFNFRTSVYSVVGTSLEPYFYLNFDSLIILHEQKHGVNLNFRITQIIDSLNHDSIVISDTYLTDLLTYFKSRRDFLNLTVPNYITFFNDSLNKIIPKILYDDFRDNTSFPCFNCNDEFFEIENCKSTLAWLITNTIKDIAIIHPPYTLSKWIINCISNKNSLNPCNFCPTTPPPAGNLPQLTNNVNNWELGIRNRNTDLNNFPYPTNGNDNCLIVYNNPSTNPPNNPGAYAIFKSRLDIADAYKIVRYNCGIPNPSDHSEKAVKITTFPIIDFQNSGFAPNFTERSGNYMTLCENLINPFVNYTENDINTGCGNTIFNWRFAAAYGVYQITRPTGGSVSLPPLYFSYPYSNGIWWGNNSPDITVLFDHEQGV